MGFLKEAKILEWRDMIPYLSSYKRLGINQFIDLYHNYKTNTNEEFIWGYEMEYSLLTTDENNNFKLLLKADQLIEKSNNKCWNPEYSNWVLETTPLKPFSNDLLHLLLIEKHLINEINLVKKHLGENEYVAMLSHYPLLGSNLHSFLPKPIKSYNNFSLSTSIIDNVINPHIRFRTLTKNIRERRGEKVHIEVPIDKDKNTSTINDTIKMDCMAYGMGSCCLQLTVQLPSLPEALYLYDQFAVLSPILMALSASSPIYQGLLSGHDTRWSVIEQSVDDRKKDENISKSRYSSISTYLCEDSKKYNDITLEYNKEDYQLLKQNGIPKILAKHIAHLFIRDPIIMYQNDVERLTQEKPDNYDFFLNINSSNWNNVRLKPPLSKEDSWKLEIRVFDIQHSIFRNSALMVFTILLIRTISFYNLYLYTPLSKVDANFKKSIEKDGIDKYYYFRTNIEDKNSMDIYRKMTINEIINGENGLIQYIYKYLQEKQLCEYIPEINKYLHYIIELSSGLKNTEATNMRNFVKDHPDYYQDSKINQVILNDLIQQIIQ